MPPPLPPRQVKANPKSSSSKWILILIGILVVAFLSFRVVQMVSYFRDHPGQSDPRAEALSQATRLIVGSRNGVANGNTPEAVSLAQQFSAQMKIIRGALFTAGKSSSIDRQLITKGDFLVYCRLNQDACAFLVHVPELNRFTSDAKDSIAGLSFTAASQLFDAAHIQGVKKLAIATRGNVFYDQVLIGTYQANAKDPLAGVERNTDMSVLPKSLLPFFSVPEEPSTNTKP